MKEIFDFEKPFIHVSNSKHATPLPVISNGESFMETCKNYAKEIYKLNKIILEQNGEHELLINQFEEETEKLRKQIKQESDARKRFIEEVKKLKNQLTESEEHNTMLLEEKGIYTDIISGYAEKCKNYEKQLAESEKKHLLDEKEWQDYCAYKIIEPQIKGCLDREREYEKKLAEKETRIEELESQEVPYDKHIRN